MTHKPSGQKRAAGSGDAVGAADVGAACARSAGSGSATAEGGNWVNPARLLEEAALRHPDRVSLIEDPGDAAQYRSWTVQQAWRTTRHLAQHLSRIGVKPGDLVTVVAHNSAWHLLTYAACAQIGATFSPLSWRLTAPEIAAAWAFRTPAAVVTEEAISDTAAAAQQIIHTAAPQITIQELHHLETTKWRRTEPSGTSERMAVAAGAIMFTSGSTGKPKPVALSFEQMWWAWQNFRAAFRYCNRNTTMAVAPFSHIGGFNGTTNDLFVNGGTVVIERDFNPTRVLRNLQRHRVNMMFAVPTMYQALTIEPSWEQTDLSALEIPLIGGSPPPVTLLQTLRNRGLEPIHVYGMTETGGAGACTSPEITATHPHSVGRPFPYVEAKLIPPQHPGGGNDGGGQENGEGVLALRGPGVITAYPDDPDDTENRFAGGWLITGDIARWEGTNLCIIGRATDTIISGGENIHPTEIEAALADLPGLKACLIVGTPDPHWGQRLHLLAVADHQLTVPEVRSHLDGKLARYKHPRAITQVDALPLNSNGKPDRAAATKVTKPPLNSHHQN